MVLWNARPGCGGCLLIGAWAIMTIILLSTSYPGGTGFGVPVTAMVIILVASVSVLSYYCDRGLRPAARGGRRAGNGGQTNGGAARPTGRKHSKSP